MEIKIEIVDIFSDASGAPGCILVDDVPMYQIDYLGEPKLNQIS